MKITIKNQPIDTFHEEMWTTHDGKIIKKNVPDGWELVKPNDVVDSDCLIAYGGTHVSDLISRIDKSPLGGYWSSVSKNTSATYLEMFSNDLWRLIRPAKQERKKEKTDATSEGDRLFEFFFDGMTPSDPENLPPPPKVLGMSWDELAGE